MWKRACVYSLLSAITGYDETLLRQYQESYQNIVRAVQVAAEQLTADDLAVGDAVEV